MQPCDDYITSPRLLTLIFLSSLPCQDVHPIVPPTLPTLPTSTTTITKAHTPPLILASSTYTPTLLPPPLSPTFKMVRPIIPRDLDTTTQSLPHLHLLPLPATPQQPGLPSGNPDIRSRPVSVTSFFVVVVFHGPIKSDDTSILQLPGVRCPKCAENGKESWVLPGRSCSTCGTPCF